MELWNPLGGSCLTCAVCGDMLHLCLSIDVLHTWRTSMDRHRCNVCPWMFSTLVQRILAFWSAWPHIFTFTTLSSSSMLGIVNASARPFNLFRLYSSSIIPFPFVDFQSSLHFHIMSNGISFHFLFIIQIFTLVRQSLVNWDTQCSPPHFSHLVPFHFSLLSSTHGQTMLTLICHCQSSKTSHHP